MNAIGGTLYLSSNGRRLQAKGEFTYNLGRSKRTAVVGADGVHGYKEEPQVPYIEGQITDRGDMPLDDVLNIRGETVTAALANGKMIVLRDAWFAGEGTVNTAEGAIDVRFEGLSAAEA